MGLCKTCKHWAEPKAHEGGMCQPLDPDTYQPMDRGFEIRICKHPEQTFCEVPLSADGFGVADGSTYMAMLATGEAFGCVRHEAG